MLRNRKEINEPKLVGVNRVADPSKLKPGTFVSLENWIPGKRYKIKKKRGVEVLVNEVDLLNPFLCGECLPGAQTLPIVCCYDTTGAQGPVSSNHVGTFNYAAPDGSFWMTIATNSGFGIGTYPTDYNTTLEWLLLEPILPTPDDCSWQIVNPPIALSGTGGSSSFIFGQMPQSGLCGKSDERSYGLMLLPGLNALWLGGNTTEHGYFGENTGFTLLLFIDGVDQQDIRNAWCKNGDSIYTIFTLGGIWYLGRWPCPAPTGAIKTMQQPLHTVIPGWDDATMGGNFTFDRNWLSVHATASYLYVLTQGTTWLDSPASSQRIYKLNRSDLSYVTHWVLTDSNFTASWNIHVFDDETIFLIGNNLNNVDWNIGYFRTTAATTTLIGSVTKQCTNAEYGLAGGQLSFFYSNNYFYISSSGGNVLKLGPLLCRGLPWE